MDVTAVLLSVMESGDILETKYKRQRGLKLDLAVFAAGNTDKAIAPELMSRFGGGVLYFKPYSKEEFLNVCQSYLSRYERVPTDIGSLIAEQTWHQLDRDVRTARGVARRLREHCSAVFVHIKGFAPSFHRARNAFTTPMRWATLSKLPLRIA
jgi:hypothetical protein